MDARSYYVESEAETSSIGEDDELSEITAAEWEEAMRQSEEARAVAPVSPSLSGYERSAPICASAARHPQRVERAHSGMGRLARAAAAASPLAAPAPPVGEIPEYPPGLADLPESDTKKTTRVVFTINNPGEFRPVFDESKMDYLIWQLERGGKQNTLHVQGYCRYKKRFRLRTIHSWFPEGTWLLFARGNEQQCRDYCTKEDTRVAIGEEHGVFNPDAGKQGHRSDLSEVAAKCAAGVPLQQIVADHPVTWIRSHQGIQDLYERLAPEPPPFREVTIQVLWGPSGTGKTHRILTDPVLRQAGGIFVVRPGRGPWDRYRGQSTILFDEFNWKKWEIFEMNQYLDKWTMDLDCRFHNKSAVWTHVVICANSSPVTWYTDSELEVQLAFRRRLGHGCRHVMAQEEDVNELPPVPDFDPVNGQDVRLLHPRAQAPSTTTSDAPQAAAAAAPRLFVPFRDGYPGGSPFRVNGLAPSTAGYVLCPDSQPPSPTQIQ